MPAEDRLTIAAAARRCGCPRSTLQRAIRAGRLHLDAQHRLTPDELIKAGYLRTPGAQQPRAAAAQQPRAALMAMLRDMQRSMERLTEVIEALHGELRQMQQERGSRVQPPPAQAQLERSMPPALDTADTPAPGRFQRKLTPHQQRALRDKHRRGVAVPALMDEYGISRASVFRYLQSDKRTPG